MACSLQWEIPIKSIFLYGLLNTAPIRNEISRRATGTSGSMKNISQSNFLDIVISLPSEDEQEQFAEVAKLLWQDIYDRQMDSGLQLSDLVKVIQVNAFTGQLTASFRSKHAAELEKRSRDVDIIISKAEVISDKEFIPPGVVRSDVRSKLSASQQSIILSIEEQSGYSIFETLVNMGKFPSNQIKRNLQLLVQIGLVKVVKISVAPGELGHILFARAYRPMRSEDNTRTKDLATLQEALDK